jgi:hypothetical protein
VHELKIDPAHKPFSFGDELSPPLSLGWQLLMFLKLALILFLVVSEHVCWVLNFSAGCGMCDPINSDNRWTTREPAGSGSGSPGAGPG